MTNEEIAIQQHLSKPRPYSEICACMGPRDGNPLCPCGMAWCEKVNGIWYNIIEERSTDGIKLRAIEVK